jgi:hypothetical protein
VEASKKESAAENPAPFWNRDLVVASAEKLQELLIKPKKVPREMSFREFPPIAFCMRFSVMNTCIILLIRYPRAKAQNAIQKKPRL